MTCSDANCVSSRCKSCRWNRSVATVVISSCAKGDQRVGSLEVKVPFWGASKSAGRSKGEPVSPEIPLRREVPSACHLREGRVAAKKLTQQRRALRGRRGRHVEKEHTAKARNHSWGASAFPHSEDSAYKPLAVKSCCACEWGGWGRKSVDGPGQKNPERSEGPWGKATNVARTVVCDRVQLPASELAESSDHEAREG
jgi:hypothetical protein